MSKGYALVKFPGTKMRELTWLISEPFKSWKERRAEELIPRQERLFRFQLKKFPQFKAGKGLREKAE